VTDFAKKSFSVTMSSPGVDSKDLDRRWNDTFGDKCPARHHSGVECKGKRKHEGLHSDGIVTWEEK
jgi:hypothetical protein